MTTVAAVLADRLRSQLACPVHLPGDTGYDAARAAWNTAVDLRPALVALPRTAAEVAGIVRAAAAAGLRVAAQSTGHGATGLAEQGLDDVVLVQLRELVGVEIDPASRVARILGGTQWQDVVRAAAPHGLTALHGSAGDVAVAGYILSGGASFYGRRHGLAVNSVRAVELVTADGSIVRATAERNAALFWAVRGGSGAFGVVTAIELELLPVADVVGGMLLWDAGRAPEVVRAWAAWTATAPESATTSLRLLHFPPIPELPAFLSGRSVLVIDGAVLEDDATAAEVLAPLRALGPEMDTFGRIPATAMLGVHMDPTEPTPAVSGHLVLAELPEAAIDAFLGEAARESGLLIAELRQLGGAFARRPEHAGAVGHLPGAFALYTLAMAPVPPAVVAGRAACAALVEAVRPWAAEALVLTFVDGGPDRAPGFGESGVRLADESRRFDPAGVFVAAHPVRR